MAAFLTSKMRLLSAVSDEGGLFECRFLVRLLTREQAAVATATTEATSLDSHLSALSSQLRRDLAPTDDTPGVLDAPELAPLQRALKRLGHDAHAHTAHLQTLV